MALCGIYKIYNNNKIYIQKEEKGEFMLNEM